MINPSNISHEQHELMLLLEPKIRYCTGGFTAEQYAEFCGEDLPEPDFDFIEEYRATKTAACLAAGF